MLSARLRACFAAGGPAVALAFAAALLVAPARPAAAAEPVRLADVEYLDWGPLTLRSHAPLFQPRLSYTAGRIDVLRAGVSEFVLAASHTNAWGQRPRYRIDGEFTRFELHAHVGLGRGYELGAILTLAGRSGGFMDGFIEGFHDLFGVTQARRDRYPRNELRIEIDDDDDGEHTIIIDDDDAGFGFANPVLLLKRELISQMRWRPALSLELGVKLPLGAIDRRFATDGWAAMLHVGLRQPITAVNWLQLFVVGGFVVSPGNDDVFGFPVRSFQGTLLFGPEFRLASNLTMVLYWMTQTGAGSSGRYDPQQRGTHEFLLGLKWAPTGYDDWLIELGLIENSINDANTPDVGFHLAIRARFQ